MTDSNISEKIIQKSLENITNIIKNNIIFEKTEKMKVMITGIFICSSVFTIISFYNTYKIHNIEKKITSIQDFIEENDHFPKTYYNILWDNNNLIFRLNTQQSDTDIKVNKLDNKISIIKDKISLIDENMVLMDNNIVDINKHINKIIELIQNNKFELL